MLGRFYSDRNHTHSGKLHNAIYLNPVLSIKPAESVSNVNFNFKSAICHFGVSANVGHYKTIIKAKEELVCCNDSEISLESEDVLLQTAYIAVYDRNDTLLPPFMNNLMKSIFKTGIFDTVYKHEKFESLSTKRKHFIQNILSNGYTKRTESELTFHLSQILHKNFEMKNKKPSMENIYTVLLEFLFPDHDCNCSSTKKELFAALSVHIFQCTDCNSFFVNENQSFITTVFNFPKHRFSESLKVTGVNTEQSCKCGAMSNKMQFLSFPNLLIFEISGAMISNSEIFLKLDFSKQVDTCFPVNSMMYGLKYILCLQNDDSTYISVDTDSNAKQLLSDISNYKSIYLFYSKIITDVDVWNFIGKQNLKTEVFQELNVSSEFAYTKSIQPKKEFGIKLTSQFFSTLLNEAGWLSSDHLNVYLSIISKSCKKKVLVVDSGWFSSRLCKQGNIESLIWFFDKTQSSCSWFDYEYIVVPVNENNKHWTVVVIDMKKNYSFTAIH